MPSEKGDETVSSEIIKKSTSELDKNPLKENESVNQNMKTDSCVSVTINNHASEHGSNDDVSFPEGTKFFKKEESIEGSTQEELEKKNLFHIIKIFPGNKKKNELKVEEIFEKDNKKTLSKKGPKMKEENENSSASTISTPNPIRKNKENTQFSSKSGQLAKKRQESNSKDNQNSPAPIIFTSNSEKKDRANAPISSKSHPNSRITGEKTSCTPNKSKRKNTREPKEKFPYSKTDSHITNKNMRRCVTGVVRPYMLDAKARREIRDFDRYLYRENSLTSWKNTPSNTSNKKYYGKQNKNYFEVKYISPDFSRYSESACTESQYSLTSLDARKKFQTEPKIEKESKKVEKIKVVKEKEPKNKESKNPFLFFKKRPPGTPSVIETLKGDDRDLPEIYSRFVRRSKAVKKDQNNVNSTEKIDFDIDRELNSELEKQKRIIEEHLQIIEKNPYKLKNKLEDNVKKKKPKTADPILKNAASELKKKKSIESKEKQTDKSKVKKTDLSKVTEAADATKLKKRIKKFFSGNSLRKDSGLNEIPEKDETPVTEGGRKRYKPLQTDEDHLHMSPTTAMTMMLLATERIIAKKSEFFKKFKGESRIKM